MSQQSKISKRPNSQRKIFPFLQLPLELRTIIYRLSLSKDQLRSKRQPRPYAQLRFDISFDPKVLVICRQMAREASVLLPRRPLPILELEFDKPWGGKKALVPGKKSLISPPLLDRALSCAKVLPLRRCDIRMKVNDETSGMIKKRYKWLIHSLVNTLQLFPALEELHLHFIHMKGQSESPTKRRDLQTEKLRCFGRLRGFNTVNVTGSVKKETARELERLIQRPKLLEGAEQGMAGDVDLFECECEQRDFARGGFGHI
ncbi:MAG: hypothetical protein L6R39_000924 [Caloplaca ligustica]|nr:MAG: hypothetical protein L6R39_000924 [Caloplaca ligustica]